MTKLMTRFFGLLFVVAFFFCFTGCANIGGLFQTKGSGGTPPSTPSGTTGGGGGKPTYDTSDVMFEQDEDGNYVFFSEMLDAFECVQVLSVPPKGQETENENTNTERRRFYDNLNSQFAVLSTYSISYLLGQFAGGFVGGDIKNTQSEFADDYVLALTELSPQERNATVGDTNIFVVEQNVTSWTYDSSKVLGIVYSDSPAWNMHLSQLKITQNYFDSYMEAFEPILRLKLIEFVANQIYGTDFNTQVGEILGTDECLELIYERLSVFKVLGFDFGNLSDANSVSSLFKAFLLDEVIGSSAINYASGSKTFAEPFYTYTEIEGEGEDAHEVEKMDYYDINGNDTFDASFTVTDEMFYINYEEFVDDLLTNLKSFADNFLKIDAMEVEDIEAKDFFTPGLRASEAAMGKKSLTNMNYAQYQSCVLFPNSDFKFDAVSVFVDSKIDFKLKVWAKFCFGEEKFVVPICFLNLDSTKDYDLNTDFTVEYDEYGEIILDDLSDDFGDLNDDLTEEDLENWDSGEDGLSSLISREEMQAILFDEESKRNKAFVPLEYVLDESQMAILENGISPYEGDLNYKNRGYHTNSQDNTALKDVYKLQDLTDVFDLEDAEELKFLCFEGSTNYIEFLFEIVDADPDVEYDFKFLINAIMLWEEDEENENTNSQSFSALDYDRNLIKNNN